MKKAASRKAKQIKPKVITNSYGIIFKVGQSVHVVQERVGAPLSPGYYTEFGVITKLCNKTYRAKISFRLIHSKDEYYCGWAHLDELFKTKDAARRAIVIKSTARVNLIKAKLKELADELQEDLKLTKQEITKLASTKLANLDTNNLSVWFPRSINDVRIKKLLDW